MSLQGMASVAPGGETGSRLADVVTTLDDTIRELRQYIFGLRSDGGAGALRRGLVELATQLRQSAGATTVLSVDDRALADFQQFSHEVLLLAREAFSIIGRHSGASTCRITVEWSSEKALAWCRRAAGLTGTRAFGPW